MSNIYIQEPPTDGKVLLVTTAGDIDIELWSKEAPKACRNFVQLCMEGYYDGTIFHRVVSGFIVQGGDPTGTGTGGESIYGKPFKDEIHSRLRFVRRGLVAMANGGPHDNGSQFFFTLGPCPELQNKHTIFGKIAGDTLYNLPRFEEGDIGKDDRPEFPQKIISTEILKNPFNDIVPRVAIENEITKESIKKKKGTKNFKLLSFGDEAEIDEEEFLVATKQMTKKGNSAHDIARDPTLSASVGQSADRETEIQRVRDKLKTEAAKSKDIIEEDKITNVQEESDSQEKKRSEIRAEIRKLKRELNEKDSGNNVTDQEGALKKPKQSEVIEQYYQDKAKYEEEKKKLPRKGTSRESQTLALLERFSQKVKNAVISADEEGGGIDKESTAEADDDDDDESWLSHRLLFDTEEIVLAKDASTKDDHWYDITDPRNALNKRRREESKATQAN